VRRFEILLEKLNRKDLQDQRRISFNLVFEVFEVFVVHHFSAHRYFEFVRRDSGAFSCLTARGGGLPYWNQATFGTELRSGESRAFGTVPIFSQELRVPFPLVRFRVLHGRIISIRSGLEETDR